VGDLEVAVAVGVSHKLFFLVGTRRSLMPESKRWYDETGKLCMIRLFYMYTNMGEGVFFFCNLECFFDEEHCCFPRMLMS